MLDNATPDATMKLMDTLKQIKRIEVNLADSGIENPVRGRVASSDQLYRAFKYLESEDYEKFIAVYFSDEMEIRMFDVLAVRDFNFKPKDIFGGAIVTKSPNFVVLHNHTNAREPEPSPFDAGLIEMLEKQAPILEVAFVNYLVIGHGAYWRLRGDDVYAS